MLNSLEIRNYRNLKHLRIEKLGRVNLVIGKNNVGKTSFLEVVSLFVKEGSQDWVRQILTGREEYTQKINNEPHVDTEISSWSNIFHKREASFSTEKAISVRSEKKNLSIRFIRYDDVQAESEINFDELPSGLNSIIKNVSTQRIEVTEEYKNPKIGVEVIIDNDIQIRPLTGENVFDILSNMNQQNRNINMQLVSNKDFYSDYSSKLWQDIALTEGEEEVTRALQIIDSTVERFSFIPDVYEKKKGIVKLKSYRKPVPIRSLGDGINRILTIILAMVNCENGYLFIDEFENGLHYSVQEKLWEIIFELAERLNIQVFATTHSNDTIQAFTKIANEKQSVGYLIKLRNINGEIDAIVFSEEELQTAAEAEYLDLRL